MIKINETIIVEGKHDKIKLKSIVDANIITTEGFRIYKNKEKQILIKNIAKKTGIIIMTDSDTAGKRIRNFIKNCVKSGEGGEDGELNILNIYIPKILGKEKRKKTMSKENLLGVEGTDKKKLLEIFEKFGINGIKNESSNLLNLSNKITAKNKKVTKMDLYEDKLAGHENSLQKRKYLCDKLNIPYMSANSLVEAVNILIGYDEYKKIVEELYKLYG